MDLRALRDGQCLVGQLVRKDQIQPGLRAAPLLAIEPATLHAHTEIYDRGARWKHPQGWIGACVAGTTNFAEVVHNFGGGVTDREMNTGSI